MNSMPFNILQFIWCFIFIISLLILFYNIGERLSLILFNKLSKFAIPLGFVSFIAIMHIILLPFEMYYWSYKWIEFVVIPILLILLFLSNFYFLKYNFLKFFERYRDKYVLFVDLSSVLIGIYLFVFSTPYIDSFYYVNYSTYSIFSGYTSSTNGINPFPYATPVHQFDTYYLIQSIFASISRIDPFIFVTSFMKFIEGFIVVQTLGLLFNHIVPKLRTKSLIFGLIGLFLWVPLFTNSQWANDSEYAYIPLFLTHMSATGTLLLYQVTIPFMLIYLYKFEEIKRKNLFLIILVLFSFSVSSSALYMIPIFLLIVLLQEILLKRSDYSFSMYIPTFFILFIEFFLLFIFRENSLVFYVVTLIIFSISVLFYLLIYNKKCIFFNWIILAVFSIGYILIFILGLQNYSAALFSNLTSGKVNVLFILGIYYMFRQNKKYVILIFIMALIFNNAIIISIFQNTSLADVYHRIMMIPSLYLFNIIGLAYLISLFRNLKIQILFVLGILLFSIYNCIGDVVPNDLLTKVNISSFGEYENFEAYKCRYKNAYNIANYNFPEGALVEVPTTGEQNFSSIFYLNPSVIKIGECNEECYKVVPNDEKSEEGNIIYSSGEYNLIYVDENGK